MLFDLEPTQIWGHPEFEAFKRGYNMQVEYGKPSSRKFLSVSTAPHLVTNIYLIDHSTGSSSSLRKCSRSSLACTAHDLWIQVPWSPGFDLQSLATSEG